MITLDETKKKYFDFLNLRHAYLLKTNDYSKVIEIAKKIIVDSKCEDSNVVNLIERGIYSDLIIVEPDGQWIKKEQIIEIKNKFKTKSVSAGKQIYIIKNAENLNSSSGNTLLKFLEEPEENIVGLLVTNNKNKVLETIVSRCQYITLDSNLETHTETNKKAIEFVNLLESRKHNAFLDIFNYIDKMENRNEIRNFFIEIINIYEKILLIKLECCTSQYETDEFIDKIVKNNTIINIKKRISGLIEVVDVLEYNINMKLLVDKLIIAMFGVE